MDERVKQGAAQATLTDDLARLNGLGERGLDRWVLHSGMLFRASHAWWGEGINRPAPHEGLDLCAYHDRVGAVHRLPAGSLIPAILDGTVVGIVPDFLGQSVIVRHDLPGDDEMTLCTIYAHTVPEQRVRVGQWIAQGEGVARVAGERPSNAGPHLHLSVALGPAGLEWDDLGWAQIGDPKVVTLVDPLPFAGEFHKLSTDEWACLAADTGHREPWREALRSARSRVEA